MSPRVMLVLPTATYRAAAFLRAAAALGIECVVASDEAPTLAGMMEGRVLTVDLGCPEEAAARAASFAAGAPLDAVVGVDEASVLTAARIAEGLGLARNPAGSVDATRDKRRLRVLLDAAEVAQPRWAEAGTGDRGCAAATAAAAVGLPCVVKPVDLAASRGVIRADTVDELAAAMRRVDALLRRSELCGPGSDPPLLVEAFIEGAEIAVEGLLRDGELTVLAVFDKPDPLDGPFFAETLYVTPSRHHPAVLEHALAVTRAALTAMGLRDGPVHAELRLATGGPLLIEVAARSIGGRCSSVLSFDDGAAEMSLEEVLLRHATNLPLGQPRLVRGGAGVLMLPVPRAGVMRRVSGVSAAAAVEGITAVDITVPPGQALEPLPEGDRYLGFVAARAADAAAAETALRTAWGRLVVEFDAPPG